MENKREEVAGAVADGVAAQRKTSNIISMEWKATLLRIRVEQTKIVIHTILNTLSLVLHAISLQEEREEGVEEVNLTRLKSSDHTRPQTKPKSSGTKKRLNTMQLIGPKPHNTTSKDKATRTTFHRRRSRKIMILGKDPKQTKIGTIMTAMKGRLLLTIKITVGEIKTTQEAIRIIRDRAMVSNEDLTEAKEMFKVMVMVKIYLIWDIISLSLTQSIVNELQVNRKVRNRHPINRRNHRKR